MKKPRGGARQPSESQARSSAGVAERAGKSHRATARAKAAAGEIFTAILALARAPLARGLLMELALERGYGLCGAVFGTQAIRVLASEPPGLVVVDLDIPDGRALLRSMQADERWRGIPVIALGGAANARPDVLLDAPVFLKPHLEGLEEAVMARFEPEGRVPRPRARGASRYYENARFATASP